MGEVDGGDALNGLALGREGLEETHDTLRDTGLLAFFVNVCRWWVKEEDLSVGELLFLWLLGCRTERGIYQEEGADLDFANERLHY